MKQVAVKLGIGDDNFTEILEGDVKEGQEAVIGETVPASAAKASQKSPLGQKPVLNQAFGSNILPTKHSKRHENNFVAFASFRGQI